MGQPSFDANGDGSWTGNKDFHLQEHHLSYQIKIGGATNLFRIYSRGHGDEMNTKFRIRIYGINPAGTF